MTGTDLERRAPDNADLAARIEYASELSKSNLLPTAYRGKPENVLVAMEYGGSLGIPPMTAIQGVHVIEGKPSVSADLMAALVRREKHRLRVGFDHKAKHAWAELVREDDPEFTFRTEWDWGRADRAGITGKAVWKRYPEAMLKARAITEVIREGASEVLHGMAYTAEELGWDGTVIDGEVVDMTEVEPDPQPEAEPEEPKGSPEKARPVWGRELTALHAAFGEFGLAGKEQRDARLAYCSEVIDRDIESTSDLTRWEFDQVIAKLRADTKDKSAEPEPEPEVVEAEVVEETQDATDD